VTIAAWGDPTTRPGVQLSIFSATVTAERLAEVARLIDAGQVHVEIAARLPLEQAAEAHRLIETGHTRGKIVLVV
jgi:NADPH:quinone reductase-like Zn-dependent oxidoreductase